MPILDRGADGKVDLVRPERQHPLRHNSGALAADIVVVVVALVTHSSLNLRVVGWPSDKDTFRTAGSTADVMPFARRLQAAE